MTLQRKLDLFLYFEYIYYLSGIKVQLQFDEILNLLKLCVA